MSSWLNELLDQHQEYESPKNFWRWAGLAALSAVLKDQVFFDKFAYKLYPNIYVMLHAESGMRKGPPVALAKRLVSAVGNTKVITGRSSIQGILKEMGTATSKPGGSIESVSTAFICSSELTSSIVEDKAATDILTDLFDRNYNVGSWRSLLKMESFDLKNPTITMLTATNDAHSQQMFSKKEIHGGFMARTFVVYENERQNVNSLMFPPKVKTNIDGLANRLKEFSLIRGELSMEMPQRLFFDKWYRAFIQSIKSSGVKDATGTLNRFDDSILKVAILLSISTTGEKIITQDALEEAIEHAEKIVGNVRRTTMGSAPHEWVQHKTVLIQKLIDRPDHFITRQQFLNEYWTMANAKDWTEIAESLKEAGMINIESMGGNVIWSMDKDKAQQWIEHFKGKM
jgi:hypothetical protein